MRTFDSIYDPMPHVADLDDDLHGIVIGFEGRESDPDRRWVIPDYQRGRVWSEEQASAFVGVVITGGMSPPCWINRSERRSNMEIIDGQQRLTSLYRWAKGEISATHPVTGEKIHVSEFEDKDLRRLFYKSAVKIKYVDLSRKDALKLYLRLNAGGTPHTAEELDRVRALLEETP